ncbi:EpsG family protein [Vibrio lentus]|uniref:EpsG family protein n=1 Tax=Vibrio lentus TaxID=136468 RepID=UPI000C849415|nr:EpsG family protein [Vibrio lentus]PMH92273.1 hypothetical protein BCU56_09750 [Vibrio lentus]
MITIYILFCILISILLHVINVNFPFQVKISIRIIFSIIVVFLATLYGYRVIDSSYGGIDTEVYQQIYNHIQGKELSVIFETRIEFGYSLLMWSTQAFGGEFSDFLVLNFLILIAILFSISKRLPKSIVSLCSLLLFSLLMIDSFNITRMVLSTYLLMLGLLYYVEEKKVFGCLVIILAASIQMTALIGLLFICYYNFQNRYNKSYRLLFFLLCLGGSFLSVYAFKTILANIGYGHYINESNAFSLLNSILGLIIFSFHYLFLKNSGYAFSRHYKFIITLIPTVLFILPLYMEVPIAYRFNYIYMMFFAFIIPEQILASYYNFSNWRVFGLVIPIFLVSYMILKLNSFFSVGVYSAQLWGISTNWYLW